MLLHRTSAQSTQGSWKHVLLLVAMPFAPSSFWTHAFFVKGFVSLLQLSVLLQVAVLLDRSCIHAHVEGTKNVRELLDLKGFLLDPLFQLA